ncbi:MAG: PHB depolymerase family esterase [Pseudomonadota bacterium]
MKHLSCIFPLRLLATVTFLTSLVAGTAVAGPAEPEPIAGKTIETEINGVSTTLVFGDENRVVMRSTKGETEVFYGQRGNGVFIVAGERMIRARYVDGEFEVVNIGPAPRRPERNYAQYAEPYEEDCVQHQDYYRCWQIKIPEGIDGKVPLVIDMHGFGSRPGQQKQISGFSTMADSEKFIVVWPAGLHRSWNGGQGCCGFSQEDDIDDVGFLRKMVAKVAEGGQVDLRRVYATGLSNGSAMSQRLANEASDLLAASASVALYLLVPPHDDYDPIPVMQIHGTLDRTVPYEARRVFPGAMPNLTNWGEMNQCKGEPIETWRNGESFMLTYKDCANGSSVSHVSVHEGGHVTYKGRETDLDTSRIAWDFMRRYTKESAAE